MFFLFPFDQDCRLSRIGMITINMMTTPINIIPSVEPASERASAVAVTAVVSAVGAAVASGTNGKGRVSAKLESKIAIPRITHTAMRKVCDPVFITAILDFKYNILPSASPSEFSKDLGFLRISGVVPGFWGVKCERYVCQLGNFYQLYVLSLVYAL